MKWPLEDEPLPESDVPLYNFWYLSACPVPRDPTLVWGTEVDCTGTRSFLKELNDDSDVFITPAHVLLRATACAIARHPEFKRRILRKRIYNYRQINVLMPIQKYDPPEPDLMLFEDADRKPLRELAAEVWQHHQEARRGEFLTERMNTIHSRLPRRFVRWVLHPMHIWLVNNVNLPARRKSIRQRTGVAMVNYLGFKGAPPLRSFKPSRFPYNSLNLTVTMGAIEPRPVAEGKDVAVRPIAPLFVRADHRLVDAYALGRFTETLRSFIADPASMEQNAASEPAPAAPTAPALAGNAEQQGQASLANGPTPFTA